MAATAFASANRSPTAAPPGPPSPSRPAVTATVRTMACSCPHATSGVAARSATPAAVASSTRAAGTPSLRALTTTAAAPAAPPSRTPAPAPGRPGAAAPGAAPRVGGPGRAGVAAHRQHDVTGVRDGGVVGVVNDGVDDDDVESTRRGQHLEHARAHRLHQVAEGGLSRDLGHAKTLG